MNRRLLSGMEVVFRCDGSLLIGYGHVSRCLTVAAGFARLGARISFVSRDLDLEVSRRITGEGYSWIPLPADMPEEGDLAVMLGACKAGGSCLITDSHALSPCYYRNARAAGVPVISFDDYAGVAYASDVVINHNIGAEKLNFQVGPDTTLLLGPRFLPLREPFRRLIGRQRDIRDRVLTAVVTLGGMPETKAAFVILEGMRKWAIEEKVQVTMVAGVRAEREVIEEFQKRLPPHGKVVVDPDLPHLLFEADLAVVNGSVTAYEAAALGTPLVMTAVSQNQDSAVAGFREAGAAVTLPAAEELTLSAVMETVASLAANQSWRTELCERGRELVDGLGTDRIVEASLAIMAGTPRSSLNLGKELPHGR